MKTTSLLIALVALLLGCATGQKFSPDAVSRVQLGMSTNEVVALAGEPLRRGMLPDGRESWMWDHDNGFIRNVAAIIFRDGKVVEVPGKRSWHASPESFAKQERANAAEVRRLEYQAEITELRAKAAREAAEAQTRRDLYAQSQTHRPARILKCVAEQKICVGMTEQEVELSWGRPEKKNKSAGTFGSHDQWVYGLGSYVYLTDGLVTSWQVSE